MPAIEFPEYLQHIQHALNEAIAAGQAQAVELHADQRSITKGFLSGVLYFADGTELHFREYLDLSAPEPRQMYVYHYHDADRRLIFRYDNARHRPPLPVREHKHTQDAVTATAPPPLEKVIDEILNRQESSGAC